MLGRKQIKNTKAWTDLEKFNQEKYPVCIKELLMGCGYDNLISLRELDEEKLRIVEKFVNDNRTLTNDLKCCNSKTYRESQTFVFLPGHRATILSIPAQIGRLKEKQVIKSKMPTKPKIMRSENALQEMLISSLNAYPSKHGFSLPGGVITDKNIVNLESGLQNDLQILKCGFSCPFCKKVVPITYKSYWKSSNATGHLKEHVEIALAKGSVETENIIVEIVNS